MDACVSVLSPLKVRKSPKSPKCSILKISDRLKVSAVRLDWLEITGRTVRVCGIRLNSDRLLNSGIGGMDHGQIVDTLSVVISIPFWIIGMRISMKCTERIGSCG